MESRTGYPSYKSKEVYINTNILGNFICSIFSALLSSLIIISSRCMKNLNSLIYKIIFYISVSEFINSVGHSISLYQNKGKDSTLFNELLPLVKAQAILIYFTDTATFVYLVMICLFIFLTVYRKQSVISKCKKYMLYGPPIFALVLTAVIIPIYFEKEFRAKDEEILRNSGKKKDFELNKIKMDINSAWCWIKNKQIVTEYTDKGEDKAKFKVDVTRFTMITTLIIYIAFTILIIILTILVLIEINKYTKNIQAGNYRSFQILKQTILSYPLIGSLWWIFTLLNIFLPFNNYFYDPYQKRYEYTSSSRPKLIILSLSGLFTCLRGSMIFAVFINGEKFQINYRSFTEKYFKKENTENEGNSSTPLPNDIQI